MSAAQRARGFYVQVFLYGPKKNGYRPYLARGSQFFVGSRGAKKALRILFKKLTGYKTSSW